MPLNIDDMLSDFEGKTSKPVSKGLDIDSILSEFNSKPDEKPADIKPNVIKRVVSETPSPPISDSQYPEGYQAKSTLPVEAAPLTSESAYEHYKGGRDLISSGIEDIGSGHPYKGLGKTALGALGVVAAPVSGILDDTVGKVGNKIGPGLGDRANLIAGAAVPVVPGLAQVSKVAAAVPAISRFSNHTSNKALSTLVENIGPENLPSVVKAMKENSRLAPADLSPRVLQDTQHLFASEGKQIDYLKNTSDARMASSKSTINDAYDITAGISPDLAGKVQALSDAAKKVGNEQINPIIKAAKPVNINNTLSEIDKVLKPGVMSKVTGESDLPLSTVKKELGEVRKFLANKAEMRTDAEDLHKFQSNLRVTAENLLKSTDGQSKNLGSALLKVRANLIDDIDKSAKGYKNSLNAYREERHIEQSFRDGFDGVFSSSKKMENDPSFTKKWFDGLSDNEKQAAREGARARIATEIGMARNPALAGESLSRSDFNKDKLGILFGKEEADKLVKTLNEERTIANTHNKIVEGSQTAMRAASKSQFAMPNATEVGKQMLPLAVMEGANVLSGGVGGVGTALYTGARVAAAAKDKVKATLAREHNARYAEYALPTEGPRRDELIKALEAHIPGPKPSLVTRASNAMSRIVGP